MKTRLEEIVDQIDATEAKLYELTDREEVWNLVTELVKLNVEKHDLLKDVK